MAIGMQVGGFHFPLLSSGGWGSNGGPTKEGAGAASNIDSSGSPLPLRVLDGIHAHVKLAPSFPSIVQNGHAHSRLSNTH